MTDDQDRSHHDASETSGFGPGSGEARPLGFCQECGRSLHAGTLERAFGGVFCGSCAQVRRSAGWGPVAGSYGPPSGSTGMGPQPVAGTAGSRGSSPAVAGLLGFIPGVGAMFNGQYAKAAMHLVVFVVLLTMADNLNWTFYWLVWGWIFYQVFDAYHTARARRDGLPLPNPFGWNEIGEKLGFQREAPPAAPAPAYGFPETAQPEDRRGTAAGTEAFRASPPPQTSYAASPEAAPAAPPAGEPRIPEENPYTAPPFSSPPFTSGTPRDAAPFPGPREPLPSPATSVPYSPTYMGTATEGVMEPSAVHEEASHRFPLRALWLIGLGLLFLMGNLLPRLHLSGRWLVPSLLAALALWSGTRRWQQQQAAARRLGTAPIFGCAMTGPAILLTLSVLMALQAADLVTLGHTWPLLLIVWGGMQMLRRTAILPPAAAVPGPGVVQMPRPVATPPPPARSTSGTGSLGL